MEDQPAERFSIIAQRLTKSFGTFKAVDDIGLRVREGEFFGFLGPG